MFEFIRRHASVLAALLLAWMTWSDLDAGDGEKSAAGKAKPEGIAPEFLVQRDPGQERIALRDPCGIIDLQRPAPPPPKATGRAPSSGTGATELLSTLREREPTEVLDRWIEALGTRGSSLVGELQAWDPLGVRRLAAKPVESQPELPPARFSLYLNATLDLADGGAASISGRTYSVGEALPGFDDHSPPVLTSVSGTSAVVSWRDEVLLLDLVRAPAVHVGGPPLGGNPNGAASSSNDPGASSGPAPRNGSRTDRAKSGGPKPRAKRGRS